jgi:inorganic pyrophosphatase
MQIAVAAKSHTHRGIKSIDDLDSQLVKEIEHFFVSYNAGRGKKFTPLSHGGPKKAERLVRKHDLAS